MRRGRLAEGLVGSIGRKVASGSTIVVVVGLVAGGRWVDL